MVSTISTVVRKETFVGLWKGISPVSCLVMLDFNPPDKTFAVTAQMCTQYWGLLYYPTSHEICLWVSYLVLRLGFHFLSAVL